MSNDTQKADQIAHRFYTKLASVVHYVRATTQDSSAKKDRWFNLETPEPFLSKEDTQEYRSLSTTTSTPPFQLQVLLCVPELNTNQVLVYRAPDSSRTRIDPTPRYILLESWDLIFNNHAAGGPGGNHDVAPPTMYKHAIPLFRSIFTLLHISPVWKLARRLRRRGNGPGNFSIQLRVHKEGSINTETILDFGVPPAPHAVPFPTTTHSFPSIPHPTGTLALSSTTLATPHFELNELESLLSSRFLSLDDGPDFTPTLVRHAQRSSASLEQGGSPRSLPTRVPLPSSGRSPPRAGGSVADRFVVAPGTHSRTTSIPSIGGGSPRLASVGLPGTQRAGAGAGSASGLSDASSSRQAGSIGSRDDQGPLARLRKESMQSTRSAESSPGPLPIRRSPLPPVHPFKASTLSSSPSVHSPSRQHSPLSSVGGAGVGLPARPPLSPASSRAPPGTQFRPSPPFAPSSLGDRRSLAGAEGAGPPPSPSETSPRLGGKRYSSSFGHRYAATGGAGSEGSAGSAPKEERVASASFLSTNTDDDEISTFVQDIDARRPLRTLPLTPPAPSPASSPSASASASAASHAHDPHDPRGPGLPPRARTVSASEPMLTTESAVDARLAEMNATFAASLRGLGARRRRGTAPGPAPAPPRQEGLGLVLEGGGGSGYARPRLASSAGSVRSGLSIASEEVLGRMDPEVAEDGARR